MKIKRNLIFWFWNDALEPEEIRRQIYEMHRQHVDGFFVHVMPAEFRADDFPGGMKGYLSEEFFRMFGVAVECARELDMAAWIYDEGGWPSGNVNGRIPREFPHLRMHRVIPSGEILELEIHPDLLNPETVQLFISMVHEEYKKRFAHEFGKTIPGVFTDEPFFGRFAPDTAEQDMPWSPVLAEHFRRVKGYDAYDAVMRIFKNNDPQARQDYCEVWNSLIVENFMIPIRDWCHANGLLFTGHFNGDDCLANMRKLLAGDIFTPLSYFDVPGCDAIWRQIHPLMPETDFSRITSSAAGGKMVLSESLGVYGADLSLAEMKQVAAMQTIMGVNLIAPMAFHYSNRGGRQVTTDSNLFTPDPRWEYYHCFADFTRRMSKVLDRTTPIIKVHVPFPVTALRRGEYDGELFPEGLKLAARQVTYDYVPEAPEISGEPAADIRLAEACPALRTRHLKSPRGERLILVNSGTEKLQCRFEAPAGFNVWYDPATGKRRAAGADAENMLNLELPFGGAMVLLTIPGRAQKRAIPEQKSGDVRAVEFTLQGAQKAFAATADGMVEIPVPEKIDADFCGTLRYTAVADAAVAGKFRLELPQAQRALAELSVNGKKQGECPWGPYVWDIELPEGKSELAIDLTTTAAPAFWSESHSQFLKANGYFNDYHKICMKFEKLFPEEKPLAGATLTPVNW